MDFLVHVCVCAHICALESLCERKKCVVKNLRWQESQIRAWCIYLYITGVNASHVPPSSPPQPLPPPSPWYKHNGWLGIKHVSYLLTFSPPTHPISLENVFQGVCLRIVSDHLFLWCAQDLLPQGSGHVCPVLHLPAVPQDERGPRDHGCGQWWAQHSRAQRVCSRAENSAI